MIGSLPGSRIGILGSTLIVVVLGCGVSEERAAGPSPANPGVESRLESPLADVVSVDVSGESDGYRFAVGVSSPDRGCDRYADWWEVVSEAGELLHRRVLGHSHVDEQPFVRSGSPVELDTGEVVWVRAHMHPGGYGGQAFRGSVTAGFASAELPASFGAALEDEPPRPPPCAY